MDNGMNSASNSSTSTNRVVLHDISPRSYEHPADRAALVALRAVPGFDLALRKLFGLVGERSLRLIYLGSAVRVTDKQFATIYRAYRESLEILDVKTQPELYVAQTPFVNAGAIGVDNPFIVLNSATVALMSPDELRFILGHELGHILSGHALYKTMLQLLFRLSFLASGIPVGMVTLMAIMAALKEWDRKSELSADRAGLLVVQDPELAARAQMKMAGGASVDEMCLDEFVKQAEEYESGGDVLDSVFKLLNVVSQSHPFPVLRLVELRNWVQLGDYPSILAGYYQRRQDDSEVSIVEEMKASARSYKDRYDESKDPLTKMFRDLGQSFSGAGGRVMDRFRKKRPDGSDGSTGN